LCHFRGGTGARRRRRRQRAEQRQTANQRPISWCKNLVLQPTSRCGTVNRSPSDGRRVQRPDQGRSGPHCSPVVSPRFSPFLVVSRRFSGVSPWIRVDFRLFATSVVQSRPDPGRMASATCTATRVRCTSCDIQMFSNHDRTKSSVVGEPGHPPLDQFSDSLILSQKFPSTGPQMKFDLVLKGRQSVLRALVLVPLVFVLLFGSAKIGQTAIEYSMVWTTLFQELARLPASTVPPPVRHFAWR